MGIERITQESFDNIVWQLYGHHCLTQEAVAELVMSVLERIGVEVIAPAPQYRPFANAVEAAAHIHREVVWRHKNHYIEAVYVNGVRLSPTDNGHGPQETFNNLVKECTWADTNEPCGVPVTPSEGK